MGKLYQFPVERWHTPLVTCNICGIVLNDTELIIIVVTNEPICSQCFTWSSVQMIKINNLKFRPREIANVSSL